MLGDPQLLTLQAVSLLNTADLVIADRLISSEILKLIKCELKVANKKPGCAEKAQEEIYGNLFNSEASIVYSSNLFLHRMGERSCYKWQESSET